MDSIRTPSSYREAWQILKGYREGDPEQASLMLDDPDMKVKQRLEAQVVSRPRRVRRPLGTLPKPALTRRS